MFDIQPCDFSEVLPVWEKHLWPGRKSPIEPTNPISHTGEYVLSLSQAEHFFLKALEGDQICGVISAIRTGEDHLRVRGIFVFPQFRKKGVGSALIKQVIKRANDMGVKTLWSLPRKSAYPFYSSNNFEPKGPWFEGEMEFGAHRYVERPLDL